MKEVDFDIIVPEYEPQAEALEAETTEDNAETAAEEVQAAESLSAPSEKDTKDGDSDEEGSEEVRAQKWYKIRQTDDEGFGTRHLIPLLPATQLVFRAVDHVSLHCLREFGISSPQFDDRE